MCSVMPRAISRSPMMMRSAPYFLRCSTSSSECARAMISSLGFAARACSMRLPFSKGLGIALMNHLASERLAAFRIPGWAALPAIASMPRVRSLSTISPRSSMTSNGSP